MRLYDLSEQYKDLLEMLEDGGEVDGLGDMLDGLAEKIEEKAENLAKVMKSLEYQEQAIKSESDRLAQRAASVAKNRESLKRYAESIVGQIPNEKLKGNIFSMWLQKNPPSVVVLDESRIPAEYFITPEPKPFVDKKRILELWKEEKPLPQGVEVKQAKGLRIK